MVTTYGKHMDFSGFRIQSGDEGDDWYLIRYIKPEDGAQDCDFCMEDAAYIVEPDLGKWGADEYGIQEPVGYCQSCAVDAANAAEVPDVWHHPHSWTVKPVQQVYGVHRDLEARPRITRKAVAAR